MTYQQIQDRATLLATYEGWTNAPIAPDWATLVNRAWHQFSWDAECVLASQTIPTVVGQTLYTLTGNWKAILDVTWNGRAVRRTTEEAERNADAAWLVKANGTPVKWALQAFSALNLVPPPNAIQNLIVRGIKEGADFSSGSDVPATPETFHEAIAIRAAWLQGIAFSQGNATNRLQILEARYQELVAKCKAAQDMGIARSQPVSEQAQGQTAQ